MIGIAPPSFVQAAPEVGLGSPAEPHAPPAAGGNFRKTMIGIAPLRPGGQAPSEPAAAPVLSLPAGANGGAGYPTPPPPPQAPPERLGSGTLPHIAPNQKTMLGIARPGIAPLNPGQAKAPVGLAPSLAESTHAAPARAQGAVAEPAPSPGQASLGAPPPSPAERTARGDGRSKPGIPALAAVAIVGAAALFAAAGVVWFFYRGHGSIEAQARALPDGAEQLELNCAACDDGTLARLDAASAKFAAHRATLALFRPLRVGENPMTITLVTPRGKQSFVDISVPIAFRVRGDTSGLEAPAPELRVIVDAIAGSSVTVDGKPLTLGGGGEGRYSIDVSAAVTGLDPNVKALDRKVPYVVTAPNAPAQSGVVTLHAGITPLVIEAPGSSVVIESSNFVLSGRTAKASTVTVAERPITVDPLGRFAQMMNVSAPGETTITVRASTKDAAPRLFPIRVKRVDSLVKEAERVRQRATSSYATIADQAQNKRGWAVALDGSAVDARTESYNTVIVMDVQSGCPHAPCLARISYGAPFSLARGDRLSAFGELVGLVDGPRSGSLIPDIRADFLIKASK